MDESAIPPQDCSRDPGKINILTRPHYQLLSLMLNFIFRDDIIGMLTGIRNGQHSVISEMLTANVPPHLCLSPCFNVDFVYSGVSVSTYLARTQQIFSYISFLVATPIQELPNLPTVSDT